MVNSLQISLYPVKNTPRAVNSRGVLKNANVRQSPYFIVKNIIWRKFGVLLAYFEKIRFCKANDIKGFEVFNPSNFSLSGWRPRDNTSMVEHC